MAQEQPTQWEIPIPQPPRHWSGYTNAETYAVTLWLDNEPDTQAYVYELSNRKHNPSYILADILRDQVKTWHYDHLEIYGIAGNLWSDLVNQALDVVDWQEIIDAHQELDND
tara:strand:+ start:409 stop:744 length:336 start_codon:yes stop_codon:yes gene_type:complete